MNNNKTKIRSVMQKCVWSLSILGVVIGIAIATLAISPANAQGTQNLQFDVFIDANTIYFSGPPGPNPGTTFIVTGYIYPGGTLASNPQVAPPNSIGEWTCRGTFTRNASETRPEVFTIQEFYLPDDATAIATEGIEHGLVGMDHRDMRATIGGTGIYQNAKGQSTEYRIGVNGTGLFNLSFTFTHSLNRRLRD
jgi:hypothetical protein